MVTIPKDKWMRAVNTGRVLVFCPGCNKFAAVDHEVHPNGTLMPSLQCPFEGCDFHDYVVLQGWKFGYFDSRSKQK